MLFGPAVRFGCAPIQAEHELQVLVRFLLVRQRPVVRSHVFGALVTPPAALRRRGMGSHVSPGCSAGAGGTQQEEKTGESAGTQ